MDGSENEQMTLATQDDGNIQPWYQPLLEDVHVSFAPLEGPSQPPPLPPSDPPQDWRSRSFDGLLLQRPARIQGRRAFHPWDAQTAPIHQTRPTPQLRSPYVRRAMITVVFLHGIAPTILSGVRQDLSQ